MQLRRDAEDRWWWRHGKDDEYTVKSAYKLLTITIDEDNDKNLKNCWNPIILMKICAFNWLSMMGRTPCKENLLKRNVIKQQSDIQMPCAAYAGQ